MSFSVTPPQQWGHLLSATPCATGCFLGAHSLVRFKSISVEFPEDETQAGEAKAEPAYKAALCTCTFCPAATSDQQASLLKQEVATGRVDPGELVRGGGQDLEATCE